MPKIDINSYTKSVAIALIFFIVGRIIVLQMGSNGRWAIIGLLVIFYAGWWVFYQRNKRKK